jgi:hypothetical protein
MKEFFPSTIELAECFRSAALHSGLDILVTVASSLRDIVSAQAPPFVLILTLQRKIIPVNLASLRALICPIGIPLATGVVSRK